jgi:hypothetical protein
MKVTKVQLIGVILIGLLCGATLARSQNPSLTPFEGTVQATQGPMSSCNPSPVGGSSLCGANNGWCISINAGPCQVILTGTAVASVNGKSGVVVLSVTSTATPPPLTVANGSLSVGAPAVTTTIQ